MRVGVEVGGTFTDLVWEHEGEMGVIKVPSTPARPDEGALHALDRLGERLGELSDLVHGSTVATNAILERKGARLGLIVSRGTRDLLLLQRHNRRQIYDLRYQKPAPVVARRDVLEVDERIGPAGEVVIAMDHSALSGHLPEWLAAGNYDAVAVCLLNSYVNDEHEQGIKASLLRLSPELAVTCSSETAREFREYERCTTTALSAYVQPVMSAYLARFSDALAARGYRGPFSVMQSNGGRLPASAMSRTAIRALFSGPAAGVVGAITAASQSGFVNLISLDMGGTSTDVCLVENAQPSLTGMVEIDGLPIKTPVIDMVTVGAGGGSIIWTDDGGMLRVGPQSAGAEPGPACYGRGGTLPTVTDAHLVRGTLQSDALLGGEMMADLDAAAAALAPVAAALDLSVEQVADAAIRVAEANIVRAIQRVSTERGRDPRNYALVPFGGAGPMLAARLAEALDMATVVVPPHAGVLSAYGLLASDYVHFETQTRRLPLDEAHIQEICATIDALADKARTTLSDLALEGTPRIAVSLEMRYVGQAFEIPVELGERALSTLDLETLHAAFNDAHRQVFEFDKGPQGTCEVVSFRVRAAIAPGSLPIFAAPESSSGNGSSGNRSVDVLEHDAAKTCRRVARAAIRSRLVGPALVEDTTSTLFLPEHWHATPDSHGNLIVEEQAGVERPLKSEGPRS